MRPHPIRLVLGDDLHRSRLTVFFRLLLAIPHFIWLFLWSIAALFASIANWVATLVTGRSPASLHGFLAAYVRYATHLFGYLFLAGNPFPPFEGKAGAYPIDLEIDPPEPQRRLVTLFRLPLALPALLLAAVLGAAPSGGGGETWSSESGDGSSTGLFLSGAGLASIIALLGWFSSLVRGRMPLGLRNALVYALRYTAQVWAYLFLLTERYPDSDPRLPAGAGDREPGPVRLSADEELHRSRLTVFFRLLLALPHLIWIALWGILVFFLSFFAWLLTLVLGRLPLPLHRFFAAFLRYDIHLSAFLFLVANPFPGFVGREGSYPVDLTIEGPVPQRRLVTAFRGLLAFPALMVASSLGAALFVAAFLGWFASLATGRMPAGLRRLGTWSLRYSAETYGYVLFLTERYPFSGPPVERPEPEAEPELVPLAAAGD